ncbi:MAG: DUF3795 domain-containing protein [Candidatus Cloacimonetes bacterium]|nr:DUF3795 domain-containing protein [Candidatus Cloacimonadota bacterium]
MEKKIAACGLDCAVCPSYLAFLNNDQELREKTATTWSRDYGNEFQPEDINCTGCTSSDVPLFAYCYKCEIRNCCREKQVANCAFCDEYQCERLASFLENAPEARQNLLQLRR